ncbi:hypothetical protein GGX14DRAFT_460408, partial [Mycena pura]
MDSKSSAANELKAEGNSLHQMGSYRAAYQKYSEAIEEKPNDTLLAVLYANRAASCIGMKEYLDAIHDGRQVRNFLSDALQRVTTFPNFQAVKLDPTYVKSWGRIGTAAQALEAWDVARAAWKQGLSSLPAMALTPTQTVLKAQFEAGLKAADVAESKFKTSIEYVAIDPRSVESLPWNRAYVLATQNRLERGAVPSSGTVILRAYYDFSEGVKTLRQMQVEEREGDVKKITSSVSGLSNLTNGILVDSRVFYADSEFFDQLQHQIHFEASSYNAWGLVGANKIIKEVPERLEKTGWGPVRRALSVTVRAWMMKGYVDSNMGASTGAVEFYKCIIDVLEWGRRTYPNIPTEDRGVIFEPSFVRGIRRLYISAVVGLYVEKGTESGYGLDGIAQMARDLKTETETSVRLESVELLDYGFSAAFWIYPIAEALSILGWYHMQVGFQHMDSTEESSNKRSADEFLQSSQYYIQAAEKYPADDENHPFFLAVAV